jgi:hypothetical protein
MRLHCGRRKRCKRAAEKKWHKHFAWWPIKVAFEDCRWLETIERRKVWHESEIYFYGYPCGKGMQYEWEYRTIER